MVTDSGDGGESGGDELPCATEGESGEMDGLFPPMIVKNNINL